MSLVRYRVPSLPPHVKRCVHVISCPFFPQQVSLPSIPYCYFMIVENRSMGSEEEEAQLGMESEDENSELSDSEVRALLPC